ncbi:MAG: hypothetical protein C5S49_00025 [Candidatus Methanogaster sp.]|nr:MAG: hypothetical protein C5S49_00025 [ANME-2 cluster archaeon]
MLQICFTPNDKQSAFIAYSLESFKTQISPVTDVCYAFLKDIFKVSVLPWHDQRFVRLLISSSINSKRSNERQMVRDGFSKPLPTDVHTPVHWKYSKTPANVFGAICPTYRKAIQ